MTQSSPLTPSCVNIKSAARFAKLAFAGLSGVLTTVLAVLLYVVIAPPISFIFALSLRVNTPTFFNAVFLLAKKITTFVPFLSTSPAT
jgi:hypothetical protein